MFVIAIGTVAFALWNPWIDSIEWRVFLVSLAIVVYVRWLIKHAFIFTHERIDDVEDHVGMPNVVSAVAEDGQEVEYVFSREPSLPKTKRRRKPKK